MAEPKTRNRSRTASRNHSRFRAAICCAISSPTSPDRRSPKKEVTDKPRKQGLMEKQRILSPGRVSPLIEPSAADPPARNHSSATLHQIMNAQLPPPPLQSNANKRDLRVTLKGLDGKVMVVDVHSQVLSSHSGFFASKVAECRCVDGLFSLELSDCGNVESYHKAIQLMYSQDLRCSLMHGTASAAIAILEVSARILFDSGVKACLEYLEAMPWTEEEEEQLRKLFTAIHLDNHIVEAVLQRLQVQEKIGTDKLRMHVLRSVTNGTDEKARREMKFLVSKLLRENSIQENDCLALFKDDIYGLCYKNLDSLMKCFMQATDKNFGNEVNGDRGSLIARIARQVDNINWLFEILVDCFIADDFIKIWANQFELLKLYNQTSCMVRYEVSRVTAKLIIALGKGQILCPCEVRYALLQTWLQPLLNDFGWIQRCCKGLDMKAVEDAISQTILTLSMKQQQNILLCWLESFSNTGNDLPNLQRAFEVWWRRSFLKPPQVHGTTA